MTDKIFLKSKNTQEAKAWKFLSNASSQFYPLGMHLLDVYGNQKKH